MKRKRDSVEARRICFDAHKKTDHLGRIYMDCRCGHDLTPDCGQRIDPGRDKWRADHGIEPWAEGGEDTPENLFPVLESCDREHKAPDDTKRIAKNKRIRDRRLGIRRPRGFRRPDGIEFDWSTGRYVRTKDERGNDAEK